MQVNTVLRTSGFPTSSPELNIRIQIHKKERIANTNTKTNENCLYDEIVGAPDVGIDIVSSSSKPDDIVVLGLDQMEI